MRYILSTNYRAILDNKISKIEQDSRHRYIYKVSLLTIKNLSLAWLCPLLDPFSYHVSSPVPFYRGKRLCQTALCQVALVVYQYPMLNITLINHGVQFQGNDLPLQNLGT